MTIGERIKNRRKQLGLSADDVARKIGKSRCTVFRYENNFIENVPTTILEDLAKVLKTTPAYLIGWSDEINATERKNKLIVEFSDGNSKEFFPSDEELNAILLILKKSR